VPVAPDQVALAHLAEGGDARVRGVVDGDDGRHGKILGVSAGARA
jgi:hypothetical protein